MLDNPQVAALSLSVSAGTRHPLYSATETASSLREEPASQGQTS